MEFVADNIYMIMVYKLKKRRTKNHVHANIVQPFVYIPFWECSNLNNTKVLYVQVDMTELNK